MPTRPSHLPHNRERTALQQLRATPGLPLAKLHPAGRQIIAGMVAKGWIEKGENSGASIGAGIGLIGLRSPAKSDASWQPSIGMEFSAYATARRPRCTKPSAGPQAPETDDLIGGRFNSDSSIKYCSVPFTGTRNV
jgi:hypothetical protein